MSVIAILDLLERTVQFNYVRKIAIIMAHVSMENVFAAKALKETLVNINHARIIVMDTENAWEEAVFAMKDIRNQITV